MALNIKQMLLTPNPYSRPQRELVAVKAVVVHWVANPGTSALANRNYFENRKFGKTDYGSAHYIINLDGSVIQCLPDNEWAFGVGSATYTQRCLNELGETPNNCTISIECTHTDWNGLMTPATYNTLVELCATLCKKFNLDPLKNLWTHKEVVGWKDCHKWFVDHPDEWMKFKNIVATAVKPPVVVNPINGIATIVTDILNVRSTPDTTIPNIVGQVKTGAQFQVNGVTPNGFYRLTYNGQPAFFSADQKYVSFKPLNNDTGVLMTMQDLNELKKALKIPDASWAVPQIQKAKAYGLIQSDHDPNELVTFGVMITVMNNIYEHLKSGK